MESWQTQVINENLLELTQLTKLSAALMVSLTAEGILAGHDVDQLELTQQSKGHLSSAQLLFTLLMSRKNAYKVMGKAAFHCGQIEVFVIFLRGLVNFLLQISNISTDMKELDAILKVNCTTEDSLKFFLDKVDNTNLFEKNWVPPLRESFYIPRHISNRIKLSNDVFKEKCQDIFVFTGITRSNLSQLAASHATNLSSNVILQKRISARFILMERERDWDIITKICSEPVRDTPTTPIHLIHYDDTSKEYMLLKSTRPSEVISSHVALHLRDKSLYVTEEDLLTQIVDDEHHNAICICDTQGTGKTWLLESLARTMQQLKPESLVAFIRLSQFVDQSDLSLESFQKGVHKEINIVLRYLCPYPIMSSLLGKAVQRGKLRLELFLDGFNEIPDDMLDSTKRFFKNLVKRENVRIFATSRPHMRKELEDTFGAISYNILPLTEENQIEYIVGFWTLHINMPVNNNAREKLRMFARACLQRWKTFLKKHEDDLMGYPLKCYLLATINLQNAILLCYRIQETYNPDDFISTTMMGDMFQMYAKLSIEKSIESCVKQTFESRTDLRDNMAEEVIRKRLINFHVWKALVLLYPVIAEDFFVIQHLSEQQPSTKQILACGLLQLSGEATDSATTATFVHRSLAEYFIAQFFSNLLFGHEAPPDKGKLAKFFRTFVQDVLWVRVNKERLPSDVYLTPLTFQSLNFIKSRMAYFLQATFINEDTSSVSLEVAESFRFMLSNGKAAEILCASIYSGNHQIIRLLKHILCKLFPAGTSTDKHKLSALLKYPSDVCAGDIHLDDYDKSCFAYLCLAAQSSYIAVVAEVYSLFEEFLGENLDDICAKVPLKIKTPLHYAVEQRHYSLVEFFASHDRISLRHRRLMRHCVINTAECTIAERTCAIDICKFLLGHCSYLIDESYEDELDSIERSSPLLEETVHVELIKFLIEAGADIYVTTKNRLNILTKHVCTMSKVDFLDLCRFLLHDIQAVNLFRENLPKWENPLLKIVGHVDDITLNQILAVPGVTIDAQDADGNNVALAAIQNNGECGVVKQLVTHGVDPFHKNNKAEGGLHLAAKMGNVDVAMYLISEGLSLEDRDHGHKTPLLHAVNSLEMVKFLIAQNADIFAVNADGSNILHLAATLSNNVLDFLLKHEATRILLDKRNNSGKTPLHFMFGKDNFPMIGTIEVLLQYPEIKRLLAEEVENDNIFLLGVSGRQKVNVLQFLIERGADPFSLNQRGQSALHLSAESGDLEIITYLVSIGLGLESRDAEGNTPLLSTKHSHVAEYLISQGCNKFAVDGGGNTFLHKLADADISSTFNVAFKHRRKIIRTVNLDGRTPLHQWVASGVPINSRKIKQFVETYKIDINEVDAAGRTIFLNAVSSSREMDVLKCLVELGADPKRVDKNGQNALHLSAIADCKSVNNLGNSALHCAAQHTRHGGPNAEVVEYLVTIGCDRDVVNREGLTPLAYAEKVFKTQHDHDAGGKIEKFLAVLRYS